MSKSKIKDTDKIEKVPFQKESYRPAEFMACFGIGRTHFYELVSQGRLKLLKCGKVSLVPRASALEWLASLSESTARKRGA